MDGSNSTHRVLIVGAGPAGAALAHLLSTRGVDTLLLERQSDFTREFRGEVLMPSGVEVLDALELGPAFDRVSTSQPTEFHLYVNGRRVFDIPFEPEAFDGPGPTVLSQPELLEAIVGDAQSRSRAFAFARGTSVKELLFESGRVRGVRARTQDGECEFRADLVIGCDGRASVVRRAPGFEVTHTQLPMDIVWCKVPVPADWSGRRPAFASMGKGHLFIAYVAADGLFQVAWVILKGTFGDLRARGVEEWVNEMAQFSTPELRDHLIANAARFVHPFLLDTAADRVSPWSIPGALVLGDAAHTMSPVGGQGVNIALRDSIVAANHLVPALSKGLSGGALDEVCRRIEAERLPEVVAIQNAQALPPRFVLPRTWWAELLRNVPRLLAFEPVRNRVGARAARQFFYGVTDVRLRV